MSEGFELCQQANERLINEDYSGALELYFRAVTSTPEVEGWTMPAYRNLVWCLISLDDFERAKAALAELKEQFPGFVDFFYVDGLIALHQSDWERAIGLFTNCLNLGDLGEQYSSWEGAGSWRAQKGLHQALIGNTEGIHPGNVFHLDASPDEEPAGDK